MKYERRDDVHFHKKSLQNCVSEDTKQRQQETIDRLIAACQKVNARYSDERAREWTDDLECALNNPKFALRKPRVNPEEITEGMFVCGLSRYKKRFLLVIENDTKRKQVTALRLVSFGGNRRLLDTNMYYVSTEPASEVNSMMADRHYYNCNDFSFENGGKKYDGYIDTALDDVEYISWDNLLKIMKPTDMKFATRLFKNAKASVIAKKKAKSGNDEYADFIKSLVEELNEYKRKEG